MESIASFYVYSALFYLCKISSSFKNSENETQDFFKKSFNLLIDNTTIINIQQKLTLGMTMGAYPSKISKFELLVSSCLSISVCTSIISSIYFICVCFHLQTTSNLKIGTNLKHLIQCITYNRSKYNWLQEGWRKRISKEG